ncbi:hypothetical protein TNIN_499401, partial [Trichonephila inaurata madagascariensis]
VFSSVHFASHDDASSPLCPLAAEKMVFFSICLFLLRTSLDSTFLVLFSFLITQGRRRSCTSPLTPQLLEFSAFLHGRAFYLFSFSLCFTRPFTIRPVCLHITLTPVSWV